MGGKCLNEVIDLNLRKLFYWWGKLVGNHPGYFIVIPILLTVLCLTGVQRMNYNYDPEYLFSPTNGQAKQTRPTPAAGRESRGAEGTAAASTARQS